MACTYKVFLCYLHQRVEVHYRYVCSCLQGGLTDSRVSCVAHLQMRASHARKKLAGAPFPLQRCSAVLCVSHSQQSVRTYARNAYTHTSTCTHVCTYVCMYVCMYVCSKHIRMHMYPCTHALMQYNTHPRARMQQTHAHIRKYVQHTFTCAHVLAYVCTYIHAYMYLCMYVCTHMHTYVHTVWQCTAS